MYVAIDIGGTKTYAASLNNEGVIHEKIRFATPTNYTDFKKELAINVANLSTNDFVACGVGVPGLLDRMQGIGLAMGNLPWKNIPVKTDVMQLVHCPVVIENDANLAGLSEAMLLKHRYQRVLYITISTGIGTGFIVNQHIDPGLADSEGGQVRIEYQGRLTPWEEVASGEAIARRYGKQARNITDATTWRHIAHDIAIGLIDLITVAQPEVIVLGGSIGLHYERYKTPLLEILQTYELPITPIPPIICAARPDDAVLYGCYDLAKETYGKASQ
ncbi:MAG TPA: ROK family protein [Candidatus Saccharimonadales bacterium]|nr:ROK family protein [Candidatus Saccharimonadales bacterium]